jgi:peptide-methionine (S)-S-oxide reductase
VRTRVGYAGGRTRDPTYHDLADHTEVFQLDYDPARISYAELVDEIWGNRRGGRTWSRQYMEAVFCADAGEEAVARARGISAIVTGARFYLAEDYHQKYYLRHDRMLMAELAGYSPRQLVDSTVAARLNGYVAGRGSPAALRDELASLGLSVRANTYLEQLVAGRARPTCA